MLFRSQEKTPRAFTLGVQRGDAKVRIPVPAKRPVENSGVLGASFRTNVGHLHADPVTQIVGHITMTFRVLGSLIHPGSDISVSKLSGPVGIAKVAAVSLLAGWPAFLSLLAGISIGLGILNLLPLPLLDGGQVVVQLYEGFTGGPLTDRTQGMLQRVGFAILILLTVLAVYNDLSRPG